MPVGVGDFEEYKLRKPEGLLHLVASVDGRSWEVSVEKIEMDTEFSMSLLEPAIPQSTDLPDHSPEQVKREKKATRPPGRPRKIKNDLTPGEEKQVRGKRKRSTNNRHRIPTTANLLTLPKTTPPRRAPRPRSQEAVVPESQKPEVHEERSRQDMRDSEDREAREREERRRSRVEKELRQLATHT